MKLSVCVLTFNGYHLLEDCLASIGEQGDERIVIDNGSSDPGRIEKIATAHNFTVYRSEKNLTNVGGQNLAIKQAKHRNVLFVSDDVRMVQSEIFYLPYLADRLWGWSQIMPVIRTSRWNQIDACGMSYVWPGYGVGWHAQQNYGIKQWTTPIVPSICYLIDKRVWEVLGGFDESLPMAYEDVDYGLRANKAGYTNWVQPNCSAVHLQNQTLRLLPNVKERFRQARLKVIRKHYVGLDRWLRVSAVQTLFYITSKARQVVGERRGV